MTPQEVKLWVHLRSWRERGYHFRRQSPRDEYIVDFVCLRHRLAIEVDGGQHNRDRYRVKDASRDDNLSASGFRVLRFWNSDVDRNLPGVLHAINQALNDTRHPAAHSASKTRVNALMGGHPPPSGEG